MKSSNFKLSLTKKIPNYELQKNTLHFLFECEDYFHNQPDDLEIHDKLDFFDDKVIKNICDFIFNHNITPLLYHTNFFFTIIWKIVRKLYNLLGDEYRSKSDFDIFCSAEFGGEKAKNLMKYSYNILCSLVNEYLCHDDIEKIHNMNSEKTYDNLEKSYRIMDTFETTY